MKTLLTAKLVQYMVCSDMQNNLKFKTIGNNVDVSI